MEEQAVTDEEVTVFIDQSKCVGCGVCAEACTSGAVSLHDGKASIDMSKCNGCVACMEVCKQGAIYGVFPPIPVVQQAEVAPMSLRAKILEPSRPRIVTRVLNGLVPAALDLAITIVQDWMSNRTVASPIGRKRPLGLGSRCDGADMGLRRRRRSIS